MTWNESDHPRNPIGSTNGKGGRFKDKTGVGDDADLDLTVYDVDEDSLEALADEQERALETACANRDVIGGYAMSRRGEYIRRVLEHIGGRDTKREYSYVSSQGDPRYTEERERLHDRIVRDVFAQAGNVRRDGRALLSGGLGGAGKSSILASDSFARRFGGFGPKEWLTLNNDDIKERMAALDMIPHIKGLTPMEASTLVHEEASDILARIRKKALDEHMNVIMDGTMNNPVSMRRKIAALRRAGYGDVRAVFVDISPDTSKRRAAKRYQRGMDAYTTTGRGYGGRWLPDHVIDRQRSDDPRYKSRNVATVIELADDGLLDAEPIVYDNDRDGQPARPVDWRPFAHPESLWSMP